MTRYLQTSSVRRFHDLLPYRVREVLLVSSPYDAFILQEDGHLTERLFVEYREVSLSSAPRFIHASNGEEAFRFLQSRRFDLILTMTSLVDMDVNAFGRKVKEMVPGMPVIVFALDRNEAIQFQESIDPEAQDGFFLWTGDVLILLAVIKSVEDRRNVDHDVRHGNVRVIIMIEDSPQYYSAFLGELYKELMRQSLALYSEGVSDLYRKMFMQSRPKVLHARSFEEGVQLFKKYSKNVMAVISDVRIPRRGALDPEAGLDFAQYALQHDPECPILLQSAETQNRDRAEAIGAQFLDKNSTSLLAAVRDFLTLRLGFGDFIFRTPDNKEFDRARDLRELEAKLAAIPEELLRYHAGYNHISIWLMARSEFELAEELRPKKISDFPSIGAMRQHLIHTLKENRERLHRGLVSDFSSDYFAEDQFSRIGTGYLGGKARGIAFLYQTLADIDPREFAGLPVRVPQTVVVTTDLFDTFLDENDLRDFAYEAQDDQEISARFIRGRLPSGLIEQLNLIVDKIEGPLAIRSSSLLEDSLHQPFAGIYSTLMIPNRDPDPDSRLRDLCEAVKLVYASTFFSNAKSYLGATGSRIEEEQMAVIIQRVIGQPFGERFYPHFSGVAQSHNYYPIGPQRPKDGLAHMALGLGRQIVDGGRALRFSPRHPAVMPQFFDPELLLDNSQRGFWALDMQREFNSSDLQLYETLRYYGLEAAEEDGTLKLAASVFSQADRQIRDDLNLAGPRVITFNNILKHRVIPLPETITKILQITERGLACGVEIEFACDMGDWGKRRTIGRERIWPILYLLQVRPLMTQRALAEAATIPFERPDLICSSRGSLGHGLIREIRDLVYVKRDAWTAAQNREIAQEVGRINMALEHDRRGYILIGPGRWGTGDEWLGIPVQWGQISAARVIVEASPEGYNVDPSQGTHFFHNVTAQGIGYLTLPPGADKSRPEAEHFLDWKWLDEQPACSETRHLRHLHFKEPLLVALDGQKGLGMIRKPLQEGHLR